MAKWTAEEINFVKENVGKISYLGMSKHINRSEEAIVCKAKRLGIKGGFLGNCDYISANQVAEVLEIGEKSVYTMIKNKVLKPKRICSQSRKKYYLFDIDDILKFKQNFHRKQIKRLWTKSELTPKS